MTKDELNDAMQKITLAKNSEEREKLVAELEVQGEYCQVCGFAGHATKDCSKGWVSALKKKPRDF
jgi:predicted metal-dependent RNase